MELDDKRVLITGGTGSLGRTLVDRILTEQFGRPAKVTIFSRDRERQDAMRLEYLHNRGATDDALHRNSQRFLEFTIGDVRDYASIRGAVRDANIVLHAAALKEVPACEYAPFDAVLTNIIGAQNIVRSVLETDTAVETVIGVSTDKACKPISVMGMTKAIQERLLAYANLQSERTRFICVRYGNFVSSRGSVVPLFMEQIRRGGPVTVTTPEMTRFVLDLRQASTTVFSALREARPGETYIPKVPSARVLDIAKILINGKDIPIIFTGIRPGEKVHEVLVSEEECSRTVERGDHYVIRPILPEMRKNGAGGRTLDEEYSSQHVTLSAHDLRALLARI